VAAVQYTFTHKQYTEQHNETEYTEQNVHKYISVFIGQKLSFHSAFVSFFFKVKDREDDNRVQVRGYHTVEMRL